VWQIPIVFTLFGVPPAPVVEGHELRKTLVTDLGLKQKSRKGGPEVQTPEFATPDGANDDGNDDAAVNRSSSISTNRLQQGSTGETVEVDSTASEPSKFL
jgi:hypothetical protein